MNISYKTYLGQNNGVYKDAVKLRWATFVVEQKCYDVPDEDEKDLISQHVVGYYNKIPICCARIFVKDGFLVWGRIAVDINFRKNNIGIKLLNFLKDFSKSNFDFDEVHIHAQYYAKHFYERAGFESYGDKFIEDGIEHISMKLKL
ncbi:hypothetical protein SHELI_v1c00930 [Spiroplasma helicoides]|uniref:N-acetyltransferase domain-containing protein n=1 Tax=Spiroplasma helicoides TaxID=216938 RepID=A0A1B3SJE4_9MOLU|nr:GNAT family N-acetyltransferase [Spiroplasma helicoides]AOG60048.1 hypothetical protein SHELI_v1c00930 [Spiroplasma helicoides]